jgi:hypothetical protein
MMNSPTTFVNSLRGAMPKMDGWMTVSIDTWPLGGGGARDEA